MAFLICGGVPLVGEIRAQGAKNAVLPMLFASLLCEGGVTLYGVPQIGDVGVALSLLTQMGVAVSHGGDGSVTLDARAASAPTYALADAAAIRASAYLLGASLFRFGEGAIPYPGGCSFGKRPLDYHKNAFLALGAEWEEDETGIRVRGRHLHGARFSLPYPSVGATVNFILAALCAEGESVLYGFAREGHVMDLVAFLQRMGAFIRPEGNALYIRGKCPLAGLSYTVPPDAVEAGTYLIAAAATGGEVTVRGVRYGEISPLLLCFGEMGVPFRFLGDAVTVYPARHLRGTSVSAAPYPGFPTDLHPPLTVLLSRTAGGVICDLVWHDRFSYVNELEKMGLCACCSKGSVRVRQSCLQGATVTAPDLRGGAALVTAALVARGESVIRGEHLIARGYEGFAEKLYRLGANIRISAEP